MKRTSKISAVLAALSVLAVSGVASASSHREAPAISEDPSADNCDLWAWAEGGTLHVVSTYVPLEEPSGGPNFHKLSDDVLYEIHITKGNTSLDDYATYQFRFNTKAPEHTDPDGKNTQGTTPDKPKFGGREFFAQLAGTKDGGWPIQTYTVTKIVGGTATTIATDIPVAPPNAGPRTDCVLLNGLQGCGQTQKTYDDAYVKANFVKPTTGGGKVFAGPRDDGFYVDLGAVFDLANLRLDATNRSAQDGVAGFNVHAIAIDIPLTDLLSSVPTTPSNANLLGVWASASRQKVTILRNDGTTTHLGPWQQVSRLGLPLVNEALIGLQDKDKWNRSRPSDDVANFGSYFLNPVVVLDAEDVGIYGAYSITDATAFKTGRTDIIDVINLKNIPSAGAHDIALGVTGDVLRVDPGFAAGFPNGRPLGGSGTTFTNKENDVTDVLLTVILTEDSTKPAPNFTNAAPGCGGPTAGKVGDCVDSNDKNYLNEIPYLALPWRGFDEGHGKVTAP